MSSPCRSAVVWLLAACAATAVAAGTEPTRALRVCADPHNLPYSSDDGSGFENRIAHIVADELRLPLEFVWLPQGRGFVRKTLDAGLCDVVIGVPAGFDRVLTTRPYYRSGYVFVSRADLMPPLASFDDARLPALRVGVQLIGDDLAATPPGYALARHGATEHVRGYPVYGEDTAAARVAADLDAGKLDAALLWGPQAAWVVRHVDVPLRITAAHPPADVDLPFDFSIAMGVRRGDTALRDALDRAVEERRRDIAAVLAAAGVPMESLDTRVGSLR